MEHLEYKLESIKQNLKLVKATEQVEIDAWKVKFDKLIRLDTKYLPKIFACQIRFKKFTIQGKTLQYSSYYGWKDVFEDCSYKFIMKYVPKVYDKLYQELEKYAKKHYAKIEIPQTPQYCPHCGCSSPVECLHTN